MSLPACAWPSGHECGTTVARVGLPAASAVWVCQEGFLAFQGSPQCPDRLGGDGLQCGKRAGHEGSHQRVGTTWWTHS